MANTKIGIEFTSDSTKLTKSLERANSALKKLNGTTSTTSKEFKGAQREIKKLNNAFLNMNKDANRASDSVLKIGKSFKMLSGTLAAVGIAKTLFGFVNSAMAATETLNLFEVSMGGATVEAEKFVQATNDAFGFDQTNIRSAIGTFGLLSRSMGLNNENAKTLSENTYKLGVDLASLTNVPINQVMADLRSGLVGQSETVYKYGIDVTEASLKTEAMAQGIEKSVRNMSQGEKMALRYAVMLKQSKLAQGDFANTIDTAANQSRILKEQLASLSRAIGSVFIPILTAVLPYLNGFVSALVTAFQALARLFGYQEKDPVGIERAGQGAENVADGLSDAVDSAKDLKNLTSGLDELNVLDKSKGKDGEGVTLGDPNLFKVEGYDNLMDKVKSKSAEIAKEVGKAFSEISKKLEPLIKPLETLANLSKEGLTWLWDNVLVPFGKWTWNELLPMAIDAIKKALELLNDVIIIMKPAIKWLYDNVLVPIADFAGNAIIIILGEISNLIDDLKLAVFLLAGGWDTDTGKMIGAMFKLGATSTEEAERMKKTMEELGVEMSDLGITMDTSKTSINNSWEGIKERWSGASEWFRTNVNEKVKVTFDWLQQRINEIMKNTYSDVVAIFLKLPKWFEDYAYKPVAKVFGWLKDDIVSAFRGAWTKIKEIWANPKKWFDETVINPVKGAFESTGTTISKAFSTAWTEIKTTFSGILTWFETNVINPIKSAFGNMFDGFELKLPEIKLPAFEIPKFEIPKLDFGNQFSIPKFASGGFPSQGEMFIAREAGAEMVGSIGGRTAVANNDQIVQAVAQGVAEAVSRVMQSGGQVIENVLMLDGDVIYKNQQQVSRRRGNDFGMGVFAR